MKLVSSSAAGRSTPSACSSQQPHPSQPWAGGGGVAVPRPCCRHIRPAATRPQQRQQHLLARSSHIAPAALLPGSSSEALPAGLPAVAPPQAAAAVTPAAVTPAAAAVAAVVTPAAASPLLTAAQADAALQVMHIQHMCSHLERAYTLQQPTQPQQQQQLRLPTQLSGQESGATLPSRQPRSSSSRPAPAATTPSSRFPASSPAAAAIDTQVLLDLPTPAAAAAAAAAAPVVVAGPVVGQVPPTAVAAAAAAGPSHQWGRGLSVGQFTAALQALPMQQRVRWKSVYPAIGSGARGKVYQAINLDTGGMLAVKVVPLAHLMGSGHESALRREALVLELAAMQDYTHPHLLTMQGFHFRPSSKKPRLEIFSELGCCLEDLMPDLDEREAVLGLGLVQKVMASLLGALEFLHGRGVVHRDVKPGNIVAVGTSGTFKLIDMDSVFHTQTWDEEDDEEDEEQQQQQQQLLLQQGDSQQGSDSVHQQQQQQQQQTRRSVGVAASAGGMGTPCPASFSAHLAAGAAGRQQQQQQLSQPPSPPRQQQDEVGTPAAARPAAAAINALSFAGTPENMAPEAAPTVVQLPLVLWDLFPLRPGQQVASSTAVAPAQDIWSCGTVLYELLTGRSLFSDLDSPEAHYQHLGKLRGGAEEMPALPAGLDSEVLEVLGACLQVDPAARPTARQLLAMDFFSKTY